MLCRTLLGLPRWFKGFCATCSDSESAFTQLAQRPLNHRGKPGGDYHKHSEACELIKVGWDKRLSGRAGPPD